jgi:hypothetical protein
MLYGGWRYVFLLEWFALWQLSSLACPTFAWPALYHSCQFAQSHLSRLQPPGSLWHDSHTPSGEPKEIKCHIHRMSKGHSFSVATEYLPWGDDLMTISSFVLIKTVNFFTLLCLAIEHSQGLWRKTRRSHTLLGGPTLAVTGWMRVQVICYPSLESGEMCHFRASKNIESTTNSFQEFYSKAAWALG